MARLKLSMLTGSYDIVRPLQDGDVQPDLLVEPLAQRQTDELVERLARHVENGGDLTVGDAAPVDIARQLAVGAMASEKLDASRMPALSQGQEQR